MSFAHADRLPAKTLFLYAMPTAGTNAMHWLILVFLLKFSTDTLGIAPVMVGVIFGAGRLWDALSDPLAGWGSDRTRSRFGRRRPWMLAAAIPLAVAFYSLWNSPTDASPTAAALWMGVSLFFFYSSLTAVQIPYLALAAELTENHHERTRISAARVVAEAVGIFGAVGALHLIENAASIRSTAGFMALLISLVAAAVIIFAAARLREPADNQGRAGRDPISSIRDVLRNPHAVRLTLSICFAEVGLSALLMTIPFVTELMGEPGTSAIRILGFVIPFVLAVPLWIPLGRRLGKSACYVLACGLCSLAFFAIGLSGFANEAVAFMSMTLIGIAQAALRTFPESIKADVIDWDEERTGERKEGSYFAVWNLADKGAGVISVGLVGFLIQGADGGVDLGGVRLVVSYVPAFFMVLSMGVMAGLKLDAGEHAEIRAKIAASTGA